MTQGGASVRPVGPEAAAAVLEMIHAGFGARKPLVPPSTALAESLDSVAKALAEHGGLLASHDGQPVGALLFDPRPPLLGLRRVAVRPAAQRHGVAGALVSAAEDEAEARGYDGVRLDARAELPGTVRFWQHLGYAETGRAGTTLTLAKELPVTFVASSADDMQALGSRLAGQLRAGDLLILSGDLGAGKTTLTQGLGSGLGVRGDITSPTFVISRVHPSLVGGPALVHVDAYRLGGFTELEDLDLDVSLEESVTVVEWGTDVAEGLAEARLEVAILRGHGSAADPGPEPDADDPRTVTLRPYGARWVGSGLRRALA